MRETARYNTRYKSIRCREFRGYIGARRRGVTATRVKSWNTPDVFTLLRYIITTYHARYLESSVLNAMCRMRGLGIAFVRLEKWMLRYSVMW